MIYTILEDGKAIELSKLGDQKPKVNIDKTEAEKIGKIISLEEIVKSKGQDRKRLIKILTPYWTWTRDKLNNESCQEKFGKFKWAKDIWLSEFKDNEWTSVWSDWYADEGCFRAYANWPSVGNSYGLALFTKIYSKAKKPSQAKLIEPSELTELIDKAFNKRMSELLRKFADEMSK